MMRRLAWAMALLGVGVAAMPAQTTRAFAAEAKRKPPYFASIAPTRARMRSGPGRTYPSTWVYVRADLPVKVVDIYKEWRKVEDPGGTSGWMLGTMVSDRRTAVVQGGIAEMRDKAGFGAKVVWRAEPGVVGRISECGGGWCRFDVKGQAGFVEASHLWGVASDEVIP
jgi:SH3-like domain-containing protein